MGRYEKMCKLAQEKNISVRELLVKYVLKDLETRKRIVNKMNIIDNEEYQPEDVYQLCDTPRSQRQLINYF